MPMLADAHISSLGYLCLEGNAHSGNEVVIDHFDRQWGLTVKIISLERGNDFSFSNGRNAFFMLTNLAF